MRKGSTPVTLVYTDVESFVGVEGNFEKLKTEEFSSDEAAIKRACCLLKMPTIQCLAIREGRSNSAGEFLWNEGE
jgi:hypothetical protein